MKLAQQKLSKYSTAVTSTTGVLPISAHILNRFRKLWSFWGWDKVIRIHPEDETSYTGRYKQAFLGYVEIEYCTKLRCVPVNKTKNLPSSNLVPFTIASGSGQSSSDSCDLCNTDEESWIRTVWRKQHQDEETIIRPVWTDPVTRRAQSGPVRPAARTGPGPRLTSLNWTGSV